MKVRLRGGRSGGAGVLAVGILVVVVAGAAPSARAQPVDLSPPRSIGPGQVPDGWPEPPAVTADAYLLADLDTGQVLASRASDERRPVASTVKILTALTVLHRADLAQQVTAGPESDGFAGDSAGVGLDAGDTWSVEDLLEGLVARSGNDAAATLAITIGGTRDGFVELMRRDAAELGLTEPVLHTPDGLDDRNRLSADELAVLARVAMADTRFAQIAARPVVELPGVGAVASRNELLSTYEGADGVKTGYTAASGRCLVASALRDGRHLVAVVLGSDGPTDHFGDARTLLDHGFGAFETVPVAGQGPDLRLKVPGGWVELGATATSVHVPVGSRLEPEVDLPVDARRTSGVEVRVTWQEQTVARFALEGATEATSTAGDPGAWLVDRAYAAMRAAGTMDGWTARAA